MKNIELMIEAEGFKEVQIISIPRGSKAAEVINFVKKTAGISDEELLLFIEDDDNPFAPDDVLIEEKITLVHHIHAAREIDVIVYYNGSHIKHKFAPSARIQRILLWAVGKRGFNIDPPVAAEMELALHGSEADLPRNAHIGRYAKKGETLRLDLIRGVIANG